MAKDKDKDEEHRQIVPHVQDQNMFAWLEGLFNITQRTEAPPKAGEHKPKSEPDNFPERVELRTVTGHGGKNIGNPVYMREWKPMQSATPTREQIVMLTNEFHSRAQNDCDGLRHPQRYGLFAFSSLKGPTYYERFLFALVPNSSSYTAGGNSLSSPSTDDDDTHRDRLLSTSLAHARWQQEQFTEAVSGVMKLQQEIIRQQAETISKQDSERRAWILASEDALSKKAERENSQRWAEMKVAVLSDMWNSVRGLLPAAAIYLSKGKVGVVQGLRQFLEGLSDEQKWALFGKDGERGILDEEQIGIALGIADEKVDPMRISDFVMGLRPDQMNAASGVLRPEQIQMLVATAKAAHEANEKNGASA